MGSDTETSPAKVTGTTENQVIARIGAPAKRVLLYCDDEMRNDIAQMIPKKLKLTYSNDTLLSYEDIE